MGNNVAIVGCTGAVGLEMISCLEQRNFPVDNLRLMASSRSKGKKLEFKGGQIEVEELQEGIFDGVDIVLSSAGGSISKWFAPGAAKQGAVVVDNTSAFRMDPEVPLVVPEVNAHAIERHKGIIANPNCSTIQMVLVLKPLHDEGRIKRVVVSTYQAVSGAGTKAINEMLDESRAVLDGGGYERNVFPYQIAFNCIPQIPQSDAFGDNGYTSEEMKMVNETRKIMEDDSIMVSATTVRVPVVRSHSEAVNVETEKKISAERARELLAAMEGVEVVDDLDAQRYPLATEAAGRDETFVGRIREDISLENGLDMWIVSDNLRKGAALNTVQIAERLIGA
jgi:aspartate-semialdehyde dehydrogenase